MKTSDSGTLIDLFALTADDTTKKNIHNPKKINLYQSLQRNEIPLAPSSFIRLYIIKGDSHMRDGSKSLLYSITLFRQP